jgi:hypothetical protein
MAVAKTASFTFTDGASPHDGQLARFIERDGLTLVVRRRATTSSWTGRRSAGLAVELVQVAFVSLTTL